jgi:RimJ/RimL family protein N-acetyltransferase
MAVVDSLFVPLETPRLRLEPMSTEQAEAILAGDLSGLTAGRGWPHSDTADGLRMALLRSHPPGWLIKLSGAAGDPVDGIVIGDCGTHGPADSEGSIEIGYGLAARYRGQGFGTEVVAVLTEWLLAQPGLRSVRARTHIGNLPSRRVLEKAGFRHVSLTGAEIVLVAGD